MVRSRRVTRAQALEELVSRANDFLTFEIASQNVQTRTRGVPVATILKEAQSAVNEFRATRVSFTSFKTQSCAIQGMTVRTPKTTTTGFFVAAKSSNGQSVGRSGQSRLEQAFNEIDAMGKRGKQATFNPTKIIRKARGN